MCYCDHWEVQRNEGEVRVEGCTRCESATLLVSRSRRFVRRRGVEPRLKTSAHSHEMRWTLFLKRQVSFDSRRAVSHWLLEHGCDLLCTRATVIRDRDRCKIYIGRYWISNRKWSILCATSDRRPDMVKSCVGQTGIPYSWYCDSNTTGRYCVLCPALLAAEEARVLVVGSTVRAKEATVQVSWPTVRVSWSTVRASWSTVRLTKPTVQVSWIMSMGAKFRRSGRSAYQRLKCLI
jgi:hypothetical protein